MYTLTGGMLLQPAVDPPCRGDAAFEWRRMHPVVVDPGGDHDLELAEVDWGGVGPFLGDEDIGLGGFIDGPSQMLEP